MHYYLIDFENVPCENVGALVPGSCRIFVFVGANQPRLSFELVQALQPFGSDVEYVKISGNGPNALDFHIAFYAGRLSMQFPGSHFTIISADTGFDPLVRHLANQNIRCERAAIISGSGGSQQIAKKAAATAIPKGALKKPSSKKVSLVVDPAPAKGNATSSDVEMKKSRLDEVLTRLKGLKKAKPARLITLKSSIQSWFKPALDQKQADAVVKSLADAKKIKVDGGKVTYTLG